MTDVEVPLGFIIDTQEFKTQYEIQTVLQDLDSNNYNDSLQAFTKFLSMDQNNIDIGAKFLSLIAETKYSQIPLFIQLIKDCSFFHLSEQIQNISNFLFANDLLYFIQALIKENIINQEQYEFNLNRRSKVYPENPNPLYFTEDVLSTLDKDLVQKFAPVIDRDDLTELKHLLTINKNINSQFWSIPHINYIEHFSNDLPSKTTLIQYAAFRGSINCFKFLHKSGASLKISDKINSMTYAVCGGNQEIIQILEDMKFFIQPNDIFYAILYHRRQIFDQIIHKIQIKTQTEYISKIISYSILKNFFHGIKEMKNLFLEDPLSHFAKSGNTIFAKKIVINKYYKESDFVKRKNYHSVLDSICISGNQDLFDFIYQEFRSVININLLFDDIIRSENISFIKHVIETYHPNINSPGFQGYTPILRACYLNNKNIYDLLMQYNPNINAETEYSDNMLDICIDSGANSIAKILIANPKFDVNYSYDSYSINALGSAILKKNMEIVELLLKRPDIEPCIYTWYNAQHFNIKTNHIQLAIQCGDKNIMEKLLSHPLITICDNEKKEILKRYPDISKDVLEGVQIRKPNRYDQLDEMYGEDEPFLLPEEKMYGEDESVSLPEEEMYGEDESVSFPEEENY